VRCTSADTSTETRIATSHQARRDVHTVAQEIAISATARSCDAFDHAAHRRNFGRGPGLIGFRPCGVAGDVHCDDGGEPAGSGIFDHKSASAGTFWPHPI
jgi:hypothetical protein